MNTIMDDCVFCKIINGEMVTNKVYENDNVLAFCSNKPVAETHIIIIPKKHVSTFMDLNGEMDSLVKTAQMIIRDKKIESGYKLTVNGGKYQEIQHFHLHLLAGTLRSSP